MDKQSMMKKRESDIRGGGAYEQTPKAVQLRRSAECQARPKN